MSIPNFKNAKTSEEQHKALLDLLEISTESLHDLTPEDLIELILQARAASAFADRHTIGSVKGENDRWRRLLDTFDRLAIAAEGTPFNRPAESLEDVHKKMQFWVLLADTLYSDPLSNRIPDHHELEEFLYGKYMVQLAADIRKHLNLPGMCQEQIMPETFLESLTAKLPEEGAVS